MSEVFVREHVCGRNGSARQWAKQITLQINGQIRFRTGEQITLQMNGQISRQMSQRIRLQMIACWWADYEILEQKSENWWSAKTLKIHSSPFSSNHKPKILNGIEDSLVKVWVGQDWLTQTFAPGGRPPTPPVPPTIIPSYPVSSPIHQVALKRVQMLYSHSFAEITPAA